MEYNCGFTEGNKWFRYRAAAIIVEDGYVLFAGNEKDDYYYSIGGAVHMGETAEDAVKREVFEETGIHYEIDHLAVIHENFFDDNMGMLKSMDCHEIAMYFMMKSRGTRELNSNSYTQGVKENMYWLPIAELDKYKAYPSFMKEYLQSEHTGVEHIVSDERIHQKDAGGYQYVLFDLDGTLTDSGPGIVNGFSYAISKMGDEVKDKDQLRKFVGPPLRDSFEKVLGYSPEDTVRAISFYREYYNGMGGNLENAVYPGIESLLKKLKEAGKKLIVATSKGEQGTKVVLEHFGLRKYFDFVATSNDTDREHKIDVIRYAIKECGVADLSRAVMIGDRENDVSAAKEAGLDSIGVLYGYGDEEELTSAGATYLAKDAEDIMKILGQ